MSWLLIAAIAYFIYAIVFIGDRVLVTKAFKEPVAYAFYTGLLHGAAILIIPLLLVLSPLVSFVNIDSLKQLLPAGINELITSLFTGILFFIAVYFFYRALFHFDASRVVPLVGSLVPLVSLIIASLALAQYLDFAELIAFILLLLGGVLISIKTKLLSSLNVFAAGFLAALFFGIFYALTDYIYLTQSFWPGFIWARIGTALAALCVLALPSIRRMVFKSSEKVKEKVRVGTAVIGIHALGGIAFVMIHYAISLSHVSLINALQGVQYIFLLFLIFVFSKKYPKLLEEDFTKITFIQKSIAIAAIGLGLLILAVYANAL